MDLRGAYHGSHEAYDAADCCLGSTCHRFREDYDVAVVVVAVVVFVAVVDADAFEKLAEA